MTAWRCRSAVAGGEARRRHPTALWRPDLDRMRDRVACDLAAEGHPWPAFAAALLATRGRLGVDVGGMSQLWGVPPEMVCLLEGGLIDPASAPPGLAVLAPDIDWPALGYGTS